MAINANDGSWPKIASHPPKFIEGLPWRKQSLKLDEPVAKTDPI
jgi:hypothetical protein